MTNPSLNQHFGWVIVGFFLLCGPLHSCSILAPGEATGEVIDTLILEQPVPQFEGAMAFLYGGRFYYRPAGQSNFRQIAGSTSASRTALSYDHQQIAYIFRNDRVAIIDLQGQQIEMINPGRIVRDIGWLPDGGLYALIGRQLSVYNSNLSFPTYSFATLDPFSASVSVYQDVAYVSYDRIQDRSYLQISYVNPDLQSFSVQSTIPGPIRWVRFVPGSSRLMLAREEQDGNGSDPNEIFWWNPEQQRLEPTNFARAISSPIPGPNQSVFFSASDRALNGAQFDYTNLFWERPSDQQQPELLTYFDNINSYVSIDWKP
jgi:hypothetical protein